MGGVFSGYATIIVLILLGVLLAHLRVVDDEGQRTLSTIAIYVASPALLVTVLQDSDLRAVLSGDLVVTTIAVLVTTALSVAVSVVRRQRLGDTAIGAMCAAYGNAGNLGLPIAAYVLGDPALAAPLLILQMLLLLPLVLTLMDVDHNTSALSARRMLARIVTNPISVGSAAGLVLSLAEVRLPDVVGDPLTLLGGMAVPSMLLAYGVSLRLGPLPGRGVPALGLGWVVALKLAVQPLVAYLVGRFVFDLSPTHLLAVTVLAALPTAQNAFVIATRYDRSDLLARDAIFVSTLLRVTSR